MATRDELAKELNAIRTIVGHAEAGLNINQIKAAVSFPIENRTLQRRLNDLLHLQEIKTEGKSKNRIYKINHPLAVNMEVLPPALTVEDSADEFPSTLQLSEKSRQLVAYFKKPETSRTPVTYNEVFLKRYRPNVDSYLTESEKQYLNTTGVTTHLLEPAGTYARQILQRLLIDLSWNSSRLEGNTYNLLDTKRLIDEGNATEGKPSIDTTMILNHKEAIEFLVQNAEDIGFNSYTIKNLHALLSNNLLPSPAAAGRLRTHAIGIAKSAYTPLAIPQQVAAMFGIMLEKAAEIENPFEQAFFIMVHLPYLQPFDDVNKRVSRLAANIPLNKANLAPLTFVNVSKEIYISGLLAVYELNDVQLLKELFIWAYERSAERYAAIRQTIGEPDPFKAKYREQIRQLVHEIITGVMDQKTASEVITQSSLQLAKKEQQAKFIEAVSTEVLSLHEGNFARYKVRPSEFKVWKQQWEK